MIDHDLIRRLVADYATPLYVYDLDEVERRAAALGGVLPPGARLLYSLKANPHPAVAAAAHRAGLGAEVSSGAEFSRAVEAGWSPAEVLYTGPGKTPDEVRALIRDGVGHISCESDGERRLIDDAARERGVSAQLLFRINPGEETHGRLSMSGDRSHFGMSKEEAARLIDLATRAASHCRPAGLHFYSGTQIPGAELIRSIGAALAAAAWIGERVDLRRSVIDLGGGFAWPYASPGDGPDLRDFGKDLQALLSQRGAGVRAGALWFESGRSVVASSGVLVASVLDVRTQPDQRPCVVLDAGINHVAGGAGARRVLPTDVTVVPLEPDPGAESVEARVVGPLCTPHDCLSRAALLRRVRPGDLVYIPNVGAYGLTASPLAFLSRRPPVEVGVRGGRCASAHRLVPEYERLDTPHRGDPPA